MKILMLGGTQFVGRAIVEDALARGHEVTLFHRGKTNRDLFPQCERILGDRDGGLEALAGRGWDSVCDVCGYVPRIVRQSVERLADVAKHYVFVSTGVVYSDLTRTGFDESTPVHEPPPETEEVTRATYGPLKAACEAVVRGFPGASLIVRPGLIVGPHDPTDRFTYWPVRIARGGRVAAPADPARPVQFVDARDLARWTVDRIEAAADGTFHVAGPEATLTFGELLETCRAVAGCEAEIVWIPEEILLEKGVGHFVEMPLWIPATSPMRGLLTMNCAKAVATGLRFRSPAETVRDTLAWHRGRPADSEPGAGLSPERERELLSAAAQA